MYDRYSCEMHTYNCAVSRANGFVKLVTCECQFKEESSARTAGAAEPMPEEAAAATTMEESAAASAAAAFPAVELFINFCTRRCKKCWRRNCRKHELFEPAEGLPRPSHLRAFLQGRMQRAAFWRRARVFVGVLLSSLELLEKLKASLGRRRIKQHR